MLKPNETVIYGTHGVCTVEGITEKTIKGKVEQYYILKTVFGINNMSISLPVDNETLFSRIHRILSKKEIQNIINSIEEYPLIWIENDNEREKQYKAIVISGDRIKIIQMMKTLLTHSEHQKLVGKKLHQVDERILRDAERILFDEFALVMNTTPENISSELIPKMLSD